MPEKPQVELKDIQEPSEQSSDGLEIVKTEELESVIAKANQLAEAIQQDKNITGEQILDLEKDLEELKIDVCGEQMTLAEIREIPDFQQNLEIWREIKEDNDTEHHQKLTFIPPKVMLHLAEIFVYRSTASSSGDLGFINLTNVQQISPESIAQIKLSKFRGSLILGVREINEEMSVQLSSWGDKYDSSLMLDGLTRLSDQEAYNLSNFQGELSLENLEFVSDQAIEYFGQNKDILHRFYAPKLDKRLEADYKKQAEKQRQEHEKRTEKRKKNIQDKRKKHKSNA